MIASRDESLGWIGLLGALFVLCACSVDPKANPRYHMAGCKTRVYKGYCEEGSGGAKVSAPDSGANSGDGSASPGSDGGGSGSGGAGTTADGGGVVDNMTGKACKNVTVPVYCYLGPKGTDGIANCHGGHRDCVDAKWTECLGEVQPRSEECNGIDDDCDGDTDKPIQLDACCGGVNQCIDGKMVCKKSDAVIVHEMCNGKDDDCDNEIDEDADQACIDANAGCKDQGGAIVCQGICRPGKRVCSKGKLSDTCAAQITPKASDPCNPDATIALDDNCNGKVDEDCACMPGDMQDCYSGPANTAGHGRCKVGKQTCGADSKYGGACTGEIGPRDEDCTNEGSDDDCDELMDEVPGKGDECPTSMSGECKTGTMQCDLGNLVCTPPQKMTETCNMKDDNCDGYIDEPFDLHTDHDNCGMCGMQCDSAQQCCSSACTDTSADAMNCGQCNKSCGTGISCCGGECFNLKSDRKNCGTCGHACGTNQDCCGGVCTAINTPQHCGGCSRSPCTGLAPACCPSGNTFSCGSLGIGCL